MEPPASDQARHPVLLPLHKIPQPDEEHGDVGPVPVEPYRKGGTQREGKGEEVPTADLKELPPTKFETCAFTGHFRNDNVEEEWLQQRLQGRLVGMAIMSGVYVALSLFRFSLVPVDGQPKNTMFTFASVCLLISFSCCFVATLYYRNKPGRRYETIVVGTIVCATLVLVMGSQKQGALLVGEEDPDQFFSDDMQLFGLMTVALISTLVSIRFCALFIAACAVLLFINIPSLVLAVINQRPGTDNLYLNEVIRGFLVCVVIFSILVVDRRRSDAESRQTFVRVKRLEEEVARMNDYLPEEVKGNSGYEKVFAHFRAMRDSLSALQSLVQQLDCPQVKHSVCEPAEAKPSKEKIPLLLAEWSLDLSRLSKDTEVSLPIEDGPRSPKQDDTLTSSQVQVQSVQGALPLLGLRLFSPFLDGPLAGVPLHRVSSFLLVVQASYKNMPYHNSLHGAEVGLLGHWLCRETGAFANMSPLVQLAFVTAALCHDVGHPGENNNFQKTSRSSLAVIYNDKAVLENFHAAETFRILASEQCNFSEAMSPQDFGVFREHVVDLILATDMA
eukprot:Cvel_31482.t1-p1 / transcript=Cvel_31482.t1 / gene=Cvel_31482 / organism=Chromera_velia_CCMP2878 / gene_product=High affinity cGMP-specific 3',5'-cyclic, putative / transcript_product=High affinity cGMP-specific 3',5'-cyclic, putative / location=Cvel_scaffold4699:54-3965(-) / protein_length=558 / sequence_SO=supercontig / SO=protein_coding / is_pseudo=false